MMMTEKEKIEAAGDVARIILAARRTGRIERKTSGSTLYGSDDAQCSDVGVIPLELNEDPPIDLKSTIDATASVLPDTDVLAEDRLVLPAKTYRVQSIHEEYLLDVTTHKVLHLVRLHER